jgi:molybdopterin-guanine dinucleotide biosynthesis protein A
MYPDVKSGYGALGGLYTGLKVARTSRIFMVACDMPFLRVEAIDLMLDMINNADVIVPKVEGHFEPLHAIYSRSCLPPIEELMERGDLKILNIFPKVIVKEVEEERLRSIEPELRFLMNVNTISQLERARLLEDAGDLSPGD